MYISDFNLDRGLFLPQSGPYKFIFTSGPVVELTLGWSEL